MKFRRTIQIAFQALSRNATRAALTALGIVIGVAAVIAMMEIGSGSSAAIEQSVKSMGANNLLVLPGAASSAGVSFGGGSGMTLTPEDAEAIVKESPSVKYAAPIVRVRTQVVYGSKNWVPMNMYGTTAVFLDIRDWRELQDGDVFSERDVRSGNKVCLIGQTLVRELFNGESPLNKEVRVQNVLLKVIGVLSRKGANMMGMDQDDILIAPWTTVKYRISGLSVGASGQSKSTSSVTNESGLKLYPNSTIQYYPEKTSSDNNSISFAVRFTNIDQIIATAVSKDSIPSAIAEITRLLRERHRLKAEEADDFSIRDMAEITKTLSATSSTMTRLLLAVALISLVVGGVGIMNIMLVSVTERTKEIGLRMAVGARRKDILRQFLVEAVVLCVSGGVVGILFGEVISFLFSAILHWPVKTSFLAIAASFFVSAAVGIAFGYYPAWKASRLDPIEALRYE